MGEPDESNNFAELNRELPDGKWEDTSQDSDQDSVEGTKDAGNRVLVITGIVPQGPDLTWH